MAPFPSLANKGISNARDIKEHVFVLWLLGALASLSIASTVFSFQARATATRFSAEAAATAVKTWKGNSKGCSKGKSEGLLEHSIVKQLAVGPSGKLTNDLGKDGLQGERRGIISWCWKPKIHYCM